MPSLPNDRVTRSGARYQPIAQPGAAQTSRSPRRRTAQRVHIVTPPSQRPPSGRLPPYVSPSQAHITPLLMPSPLQGPTASFGVRRSPRQHQDQLLSAVPGGYNALGIFTPPEAPGSPSPSHPEQQTALARLRTHLLQGDFGVDMAPIVRQLRFAAGDDSAQATAGMALLDEIFDQLADRGENDPTLDAASLHEVVRSVTQAPFPVLALAQTLLSVSGDSADAIHAQRRVLRAIAQADAVGAEVAHLLLGLLPGAPHAQAGGSYGVVNRAELAELVHRLGSLPAPERLVLAACIEHVVLALTPRGEPLFGLIDVFHALQAAPHAQREQLVQMVERSLFVSLRTAGRLLLALHRLPEEIWDDAWHEARNHVSRIEQALGNEPMRLHLSTLGFVVPVSFDADDERLAFVEAFADVYAQQGGSAEHMRAAFELAQRLSCFGALREQFRRLVLLGSDALRRERLRIHRAIEAAAINDNTPSPPSPQFWLGPIR